MGMKPLNKPTTGVLNRLIENLPEAPGSNIKIHNDESYMAVHVDRLAEDRVAVAHYGTQNGDLMSDPMMEFIKYNGKWYPAVCEMHYMGLYQVAMRPAEGGGYRYTPRLNRDLCAFADTWFDNIRNQQGLRRKNAA
jgi:hypothetical protein